MRDPARIDQVLSAIRELWMEYPDLRLGQLLLNAVRASDPNVELYAVEDTALLRKLATHAKQLGQAARPSPDADLQT